MALSELEKRFRKAMGKPSPASPSGIQFKSLAEQSSWKDRYVNLGAGWYRDGFAYLFGQGLADLLPCLDAWSFLVPPLKDPVVVGRNAYGVLLIVLDSAQPNPRVGMLDPTRVSWWTDPRCTFGTMIGVFIPEGILPHFLDENPYRAWRSAGGKQLAVNEMLAPKTPVALGGKMEVENFQVSDIVTYYKASGSVYAKKAKSKRTPKGRPK